MPKSCNLSRSVPHKPILFIDFDDTICIGSNSMDIAKEKIEEIFVNRGFSYEEQNKIHRNLCREGKKGLYNQWLYLCDNDFEKLNDLLDEVIVDSLYTNIERNDELYKLLEKASEKYDLYILTNNCKQHTDLSCRHLFGKSIDDIEFIKCYDILRTFDGERFWPKQVSESYEKYCQTVGADPRECTLIDDIQNYVNVARKAKLNGFNVNQEHDLTYFLTKVKNVSTM